MNNDTSRRELIRYTTISKYCGAMVVTVGGLVLTGWIFNIPLLKSVLPGFVTMKVNTAIAFIFSGLVLWFANRKGPFGLWVSRIFGIVVLLIGILTVGEYIFSTDLGIDQFFFKVATPPDSPFPGRMSYVTALCFMLFGVCLISIQSNRKSLVLLSQSFAVSVLLISSLALVGYLYDAKALYKLDTFSSMALNTAASLLICSVGVLCARPDQGWINFLSQETAGGLILRRLLPYIVGVPILLGWLIIAGEHAGWYQANFGLVIISIATAVFLAAILWGNSGLVNRIDENRKLAETVSKENENRYQYVLDHMLEGAQIIGFDWRYLYVNDTAAIHGHQSREKLLGRTMMEVYPGIENTILFAILEGCMQERVAHSMENEFTYSDGTKGWFELSIQPIAEGLFILSNDITKRKLTEKELHKLNIELEQRVADRTAAVNTANEQLHDELALRKQAQNLFQQQNNMLASLHEITLDLLKRHNIDQLLNRLVELSAEFLDAPYAEIMFLENDKLLVKAATVNQSFLVGELVGRDEAILTWKAFDTCAPVVMNDYANWPQRRHVYDRFTLHGVAEFPILDNDQCIGVLSLGRDKKDYDFNEDQIRFGSLFASLAALVLNNAEMRESLRQQSIRDPLTGLFNRRYMESKLLELALINESVGVIMLDIDHFKRFNDSHGHPTGDLLISEVGRFLQKNSRGRDIACRYGGEEFILIMPNTPLEILQRRAEFLREGVEKMEIRDDNFSHNGLTISLGIAVYPQHGQSIEEVIRVADSALYRAKQGGRNLTVTASQ